MPPAGAAVTTVRGNVFRSGSTDVLPAPVNRSGSRDRPATGANGKPDKITRRLVKTQGVTMQLQELVDGDPQVFSPARIAGVLRTTKSEVAGTPGLGKGALSRASRVKARKTQTRLREMVEILRRVEAYTGSSPLVAYAWFRSEMLPGFAGKTPDQLVREGKAGDVQACLDRIMAGGYA